MSNITNIFLIAGTSDSKSAAGSNETLELEVTASGVTYDLYTDSGSRSDKWGSKSDPGDAAIWEWENDKWSDEGDFTFSEVTTVELEITGTNMWLPANIFVVMVDEDGASYFAGSYPQWPTSQQFSTDDSEGETGYELYPQMTES